MLKSKKEKINIEVLDTDIIRVTENPDYSKVAVDFIDNTREFCVMMSYDSFDHLRRKLNRIMSQKRGKDNRKK